MMKFIVLLILSLVLLSLECKQFDEDKIKKAKLQTRERARLALKTSASNLDKMNMAALKQWRHNIALAKHEATQKAQRVVAPINMAKFTKKQAPHVAAPATSAAKKTAVPVKPTAAKAPLAKKPAPASKVASFRFVQRVLPHTWAAERGAGKKSAKKARMMEKKVKRNHAEANALIKVMKENKKNQKQHKKHFFRFKETFNTLGQVNAQALKADMEEQAKMNGREEQNPSQLKSIYDIFNDGSSLSKAQGPWTDAYNQKSPWHHEESSGDDFDVAFIQLGEPKLYSRSSPEDEKKVTQFISQMRLMQKNKKSKSDKVKNDKIKNNKIKTDKKLGNANQNDQKKIDNLSTSVDAALKLTKLLRKDVKKQKKKVIDEEETKSKDQQKKLQEKTDKLIENYQNMKNLVQVTTQNKQQQKEAEEKLKIRLAKNKQNLKEWKNNQQAAISSSIELKQNINDKAAKIQESCKKIADKFKNQSNSKQDKEILKIIKNLENNQIANRSNNKIKDAQKL